MADEARGGNLIPSKAVSSKVVVLQSRDGLPAGRRHVLTYEGTCCFPPDLSADRIPLTIPEDRAHPDCETFLRNLLPVVVKKIPDKELKSFLELYNVRHPTESVQELVNAVLNSGEVNLVRFQQQLWACGERELFEQIATEAVRFGREQGHSLPHLHAPKMDPHHGYCYVHLGTDPGGAAWSNGLPTLRRALATMMALPDLAVELVGCLPPPDSWLTFLVPDCAGASLEKSLGSQSEAAWTLASLGVEQVSFHQTSPFSAEPPVVSQAPLVPPDYAYTAVLLYDLYDDEACRIAEHVLECLEGSGIKVYFPDRDFDQERSSADNIYEAVKSSLAAVLILTPAFTTCMWGSFLEMLALEFQKVGSPSRLVPVGFGTTAGDIPEALRPYVELQFPADGWQDGDSLREFLLAAVQRVQRSVGVSP